MKLMQVFLIGLATLTAQSTALAGKIQIEGMRPGSTAYIKVYGANNQLLYPTIEIRDRAPEDGKVAVEIGQQDKVKRIVTFKLDINGNRQVEDGKFKTRTMIQVEPFQLPSFVGVEPLNTVMASFDIEAFVAQANPFAPGQLLTVTNGLIAESTAIRFKNADSIPFPPDEPFDVALLDVLPDYSGRVVVGPATVYAPIPEPLGWQSALVGSGLIALALGGLRTRPPRRASATRLRICDFGVARLAV